MPKILVDPLRNLPEFKKVMAQIKKKFWARHSTIKDELEEKGLYPFEEYLK